MIKIKKILMASVLTGVIFLCSIAQAETIHGPDADKATHFAVSALVGYFSPETSLALGFSKELIDDEFDERDIVADGLGTWFGYTFSQGYTDKNLWQSSDWWLFVTGQIMQWGNINYMQDMGMYETNDLYGEHPSKQKTGWIKAGEMAVVYLLCQEFPEHRNKLLKFCNFVVYGFMIYDACHNGVAMEFRF